MTNPTTFSIAAGLRVAELAGHGLSLRRIAESASLLPDHRTQLDRWIRANPELVVLLDAARLLVALREDPTRYGQLETPAPTADALDRLLAARDETDRAFLRGMHSLRALYEDREGAPLSNITQESPVDFDFASNRLRTPYDPPVGANEWLIVGWGVRDDLAKLGIGAVQADRS